jgi:hypothetical protein
MQMTLNTKVLKTCGLHSSVTQSITLPWSYHREFTLHRYFISCPEADLAIRAEPTWLLGVSDNSTLFSLTVGQRGWSRKLAVV